MKIAIDPGHGMSNRQMGIYDPGATHIENGFQFQEADIVLRYGLAPKDALRARQIEAFMTRDDASDHTPVGARGDDQSRWLRCTGVLTPRSTRSKKI